MGTLNSWDVVDANNNATPPDGWPENTMQYSEVNNTGRAVQGTLKRYFADLNGSLVAGGVADAYTLSLNETGYTSYFTGMHFACEINAENTGAATIDVNGIGAQSIVNRDGSALNAGALQSGGIYEMRYDGVNFQVIGSLAGASVSVDDATFTNSNAPDLVDTDVAVNVGATDPDTAQHIEIGPQDIVSKSNSTTASELNIGQLGSNLRLGPQSGSGNVYLYDAGELKLQTTNIGVSVNGDVTSSSPPVEADTPNTVVELYDLNRVTRLGYVGYPSLSSLVIDNEIHGGLLALRGENTAGTLQNCVVADPDSNVQLYYQNANKIETAGPSAIFRGSVASSTPPDVLDAVETYLQLYDTGSNRLSYIGFSGSGNLVIANEMHGGAVQLVSEDDAGTARLLFFADPDADAVLYYQGANVAGSLPAASGGFQANNTLTGGGFERVLTTSDAFGIYRGCTAYRSTSLAVAVTTPTDIPFNAEDHDTDNIHDLVTNTERLTVPAGISKVRMSGGLRTTNACEGLVTIRKNGGTTYIGSAGSERDGAGVSNPQENFNMCGAIINVTPGDFFTLNATFYGSGETVEASNTWLSMEIIE